MSNQNTNLNIAIVIININDYWHPGFAWAIIRKAYEKICGLYDKGILGSGDNIMALSLINKCSNNNITPTEKKNETKLY